ncbi:MAG: tetratricopeptide repeat protein, partial [SAR324 cluster bacterium]|nr:tetratricopeptide repeat protein [SAR324 cluster bacterium]
MNPEPALSAGAVQALLEDLRAYESEQEQDTSDHLPPYHCGLIHARLEDHDAAVRSYQQAVARNPAFAPAYYNMALAYAAQGSVEEAERAYGQAI